jgi:hypothetical protein
MTTETSLQKIEPLPMSPSVEAMITLAIERGATVETIERLMAVRREVRAEQAKEAYDTALASFQAECPTIAKTAKVMNKDGRSVRYQYAPLDAIIHQVKGLLQKHGFSYTVNAKAEPTSVKAVCKLTHAYGHSESSEFEVPIDPEAYMNPAQRVASALTFAKRYAFCNSAGIMTGDADDDSQASHEPKQAPSGTAKRADGAKSPSAVPNVPRGESKPATEEQRARWITMLQPLGKSALDYAYEHSWLLPPSQDFPGEPLQTLDLKHVPATKAAAQEILNAIRSRMDAQKPQAASGPSDTSQPHAKSAQNRKPEAKAGQSEPDHHKSEWWNFPMPWGKHAGTPLGELDKKYLFGLWANYEVEKEFKGRPKKPETIANDEHFREMLDQAGEEYEFEEPDNRD